MPVMHGRPRRSSAGHWLVMRSLKEELHALLDMSAAKESRVFYLAITPEGRDTFSFEHVTLKAIGGLYPRTSFQFFDERHAPARNYTFVVIGLDEFSCEHPDIDLTPVYESFVGKDMIIFSLDSDVDPNDTSFELTAASGDKLLDGGFNIFCLQFLNQSEDFALGWEMGAFYQRVCHIQGAFTQALYV
jgi:hypothetical protein